MPELSAWEFVRFLWLQSGGLALCDINVDSRHYGPFTHKIHEILDMNGLNVSYAPGSQCVSPLLYPGL